MKNSNLMNAVSRKLHMAGLHVKKHSPEILLATGIIGVVASAVAACKASTKVSYILDEAKNEIDVIHESVKNGSIVEVKDGGECVVCTCSEEDSKKYLAAVYMKTGVKLAKLYGPSIAMGAMSLTCILASHNIIHKRNVALSAAYATIDTSFKEYRNRVIERFGKDLDRELRYDVKTKEVEDVVVDEDGNESVIKSTITVPGLDHSDYARCFDEYCTGWRNDAEYNRSFLRQMQAWANNKLQQQGFLYLNDVYEMLGFPKSKAGQVVGWIYDKTGELGKGDNYVDFGMYEFDKEVKRDFYNLREKSIWLDFNVDGNIWELMS